METGKVNSQTTTRELTFGEKAAGVSFNPGGHSEVNDIKQQAAKMIDTINDLRKATTSSDKIRYYSAAITELEKAQMLAVKAITWQY